MIKRGFVLIVLVVISNCYAQQAEEVFNLGLKAYKNGDFKLADSMFISSIQYGKRINAVTYENYYNCGIVKRQLNQMNLAIAYFDTAIFLNPKYFPSYYERSICYYWNEEYKACIKSVDEGLTVNGKNLDILVLGAMACLADSSYLKGGIYCSKGKLVQKDSRFYGIQILLFLQFNELEKAKKEIQLGESYFKDNKDILEAKLFYSFLMKDFDGMKPIIKRLGSNYPFLISEKSFKDKIIELAQ